MKSRTHLAGGSAHRPQMRSARRFQLGCIPRLLWTRCRCTASYPYLTPSDALTSGFPGRCGSGPSASARRWLEMCGPPAAEDDPVGWSERDFDYECRRVARSVRHISQEAEVIDAAHLILVDDLSSWLGSGSPPSPRAMVDALRGAGHSAAVAHYGKPAFRTDAPWDAIVGASTKPQPPM